MSVATTSKNDKGSFAQAVVDRLKAKGWPGQITYKPDDFSISLGVDKGASSLFLGNSYADWLAAADDDGRFRIVDRLVTVAFQTLASDDNQTFDKVAANILPAVRNRSYVENIWMAENAPDMKDMFKGASRPLADWLTVILTINSDASIATCTSKHLSDWGKGFDDVMAVAMQNLKAFKTQAFERQSGGFYLLSTDDAYDPSILLLPERISALPLKGQPVAIAVNRTCVVVAGSEDIAGLKAMAEFVEAEYPKDPRAISYLPLILTGNAWQPFTPATDTYAMIHRLRSLQSLTDYRGQMDIMNAYNTAIKREVYVGQLDAIQDGDKLVTWASLVSGIVTLLPISDVVIVAPANLKNPFVRKFSDLLTVAGSVPQEPDTWPPLYVFNDGLDHRLADFLRDKYPQPKEFPEIGKH